MKVETEDKIEIACTNFKKVKKSKKRKFDKIEEWLEKESNIFLKETRKTQEIYPNFKRGQIIKVDFGINIGTELSHTHFAIVLNGDDTTLNDNITVLPITSKNGYKRIYLGKLLKKAIPNTIKYNLDCYGVLTQIKTISKQRIFETSIDYICNEELLNKIDDGVKKYLTKS